MCMYTQKMYKAEHKKVLWMAEGSGLYQAGWPWGLCHQLRGVVSDLGVPSVLVSHPTWFYLSGLFLEWLFSAFICPDYQHAEESCLVFT